MRILYDDYMFDGLSKIDLGLEEVFIARQAIFESFVAGDVLEFEVKSNHANTVLVINLNHSVHICFKLTQDWSNIKISLLQFNLDFLSIKLESTEEFQLKCLKFFDNERSRSQPLLEFNQIDRPLLTKKLPKKVNTKVLNFIMPVVQVFYGFNYHLQRLLFKNFLCSIINLDFLNKKLKYRLLLCEDALCSKKQMDFKRIQASKIGFPCSFDLSFLSHGSEVFVVSMGDFLNGVEFDLGWCSHIIVPAFLHMFSWQDIAEFFKVIREKTNAAASVFVSLIDMKDNLSRYYTEAEVNLFVEPSDLISMLEHLGFIFQRQDKFDWQDHSMTICVFSRAQDRDEAVEC